MVFLRRALALSAVFVLVVVLAGCGGGTSPEQRREGRRPDHHQGDVQPLAEDRRRVGRQAQNPAPRGAQGHRPNPDDGFKACIAAKKATRGQAGQGPAKRRPTPSSSTQCQQEYNSLRDQVLQFLIQATWLDSEAKDQGVKVTDAEVQKQFDKRQEAELPEGSRLPEVPQAARA